MSKKRHRSLGKGVEALLGEENLASFLGESPEDVYGPSTPLPEQPNQLTTKKVGDQDNTVTELPLEHIQPGPWQPRRTFDEESLRELAESIKSKGLLQPVLVCPYKDGYALIAGERRWRASQMAGLKNIPVLVRRSDDVDSGLIALIENVQRTALDPLEVAQGLVNLQERGLTHQELASSIGMARSSVTNSIRLLSLPKRVKQLLREGVLEMGHARALLALDPEKQLGIAHTIAKRGLSVRQAEQLIRQEKSPSLPKANPSPVDPNIASLARQLGDSIAAKVEIRHNPKGEGELRIAYSSTTQLNALLTRLAPEIMAADDEEKPSAKLSEPVVLPPQQLSEQQSKPINTSAQQKSKTTKQAIPPNSKKQSQDGKKNLEAKPAITWIKPTS